MFTFPVAFYNPVSSGGVTDPHAANVVFYLVGSGANNSTTFTDISSSPKAITTYGDTKISTAQTNPSILFDGAGDLLYVPPNSDFGFGTGDFTIEAYVNLNNLGTQSIFSSLTTVPSVAPHLYYQSGSGLIYYTNSANRIAGSALTVGVRTHVAISRVSGVTKLFVGGVQSGSSYTDTNNYGTSNPFVIGDYGNPPSKVSTINGYQDNIKVTYGVGRYTTTFNPIADTYLAY